jgi:two-component system, OmpR family, sensor histidine kinase VanS
MRVLVVEDEPYLAEAIRDGLRLDAIAADIAGDGDTALQLLIFNTYDIAVLDRDIPGPSGDEIAKRIVASGSGMPILMLTAADRLDDKASGFELGADDYLTKPFALRELVLRLRALDRRRAHNRPPMREIAGLRLDPFRREVYRDGRYVALTRKQFAVLEVLVAAEGGVVSAEELLERAWDENADPFTNAVRITVSGRANGSASPGSLPPYPAPDTASTRNRTPVPREASVDRAPGLSVRLKLTLSYAGFLMLAGTLMFAAVWLEGQHRQSFQFLLQYVPHGAISTIGHLVPGNHFFLRAFAPAAAIVLAFLLVFGLMGGWLLAGRMLAPLTRVTDATRMAGAGSLSHRILLPGRRDEFRELADAFDTMLARLEAHIAQQQRFAANASHELRTPLAITQTLLDVARNDPNCDAGDLVDRLHTVNTRAIALTEALLLLSRADRRSFTREPVDLSLIAEEATETLLPLAEKRGLTIETSGDTTPTIGSHALLLQMTTNLVHNAIVHNLPEHGTVQVKTAIRPESVMLTVENSGEKLTPELVSTLTEPFQRGNERVRTDHTGAGLGLTIVKSITQAHDGTLTLTPRAAGGLCATVQLPAVAPHTRR